MQWAGLDTDLWSFNNNLWELVTRVSKSTVFAGSLLVTLEPLFGTPIASP